MSAVDVLAVMDFEIRRREEAGNIERSDRLQEARAAVAELMEVCDECEKLESVFPCPEDRVEELIGTPADYHAKMQAAYKRRAAALIRCKGWGA